MGQTLTKPGLRVETPEGYKREQDKLDDLVYGPHIIFTATDPAKEPKVLMGLPYKSLTIADHGMLETRLDQRMQSNAGNTLRLIRHYSMNYETQGAYWEYPVNTLEKEIMERRRSTLSYVQLTRVVYI